MDDLISRRAAIDALADYIHNVDRVIGTGHLSADDCKDAAISVLADLPSAQPKTGRDCTNFVRWLMDEVMDEENWQLNAVANGEIICRKLKKLGLLDVVDGYYVETQKTGEWIHDGYDFPHGNDWIHCSVCGSHHSNSMPCNYCDNCGAQMKGADDE